MIWAITNKNLPGHLPYIRNAPHTLYVSANNEDTFASLMQRPRVAIVGTRLVTSYGRQVTTQLTNDLAAHGIVTVSGLALGIDSIAHRASLQANGLTLAVLPGPVDEIYPRSHHSLARQIIVSGGALVSEYAPSTPAYKPNFIARNRIVSGLANALLITEAAENSGTMHTARFAMEQGIDVLAVPGNITSPTSVGTNNLIKQGATPVTNVSDILHALDLPTNEYTIAKRSRLTSENPGEQALLDLLEQGIADGSELLRQSAMPVEQFNHHMTMLEITAKVRALGANHWGLA